MEQAELETLLNHLIVNWEGETVEFKRGGNGFSTNDIGKYFSALSNEANLRNSEKAWLVFGVNDKSRQIIGTDYRSDSSEHLQSLKNQISDTLEPSITFRNIYEFLVEGNRIIIFEIPAAPRGMPVSYNGHFYGRAGESLTNLGLDKLDEIRAQTIASDWSAQIVDDASINDIDEAAIAKARQVFSTKHANRFTEDEIANWSDTQFLDRAKLTIDGKVTRTALLLLGKEESKGLLTPHPAQMTWKLVAEERAYEHFSIPFLLTSTDLYNKIRNIQIRILPDNQLIPHEISKYDQKIILEALHNCIAHQDYTRNGRIIVTEMTDKLIFENEGGFFEGAPDDYSLGEKSPRKYRNSFLVEAMVSLNMIDKMGYGIFDMHKGQAKRYLPMPDYDISEHNAVKLTIYGSVVEPAYSKLLAQNSDLSLNHIIVLDRIQKHLPVSDDAVNMLKRLKLVEGRKPHYHISSYVAFVTNQKADYIKTRSQDDEHYKKLIVDYLTQFHKAERKDIDDLLLDKISNALSNYQKSRKIGNLLTALRRSGRIENVGSRTAPEWTLAERK